jgi:hypothetical protein
MEISQGATIMKDAPKSRKCQLCGRRRRVSCGDINLVTYEVGGRRRWLCWRCQQRHLHFALLLPR